jgi:hypothetical protein
MNPFYTDLEPVPITEKILDLSNDATKMILQHGGVDQEIDPEISSLGAVRVLGDKSMATVLAGNIPLDEFGHFDLLRWGRSSMIEV